MPPRAQNRKRPGKRRNVGWSRRYLYGAVAVLAAALAAVLITVFATGGSSKAVGAHQAAVNYTLANGTKVYGGLGPEGVPLEMGPPLAPANTGLTGTTIDGIQCLSTEQIAYHHHVHIAIFVDGKPYSVPIGVGMVAPIAVTQTNRGPFAQGSQKCLYWLHVHAQDGIVHIESPEARDFELGQFFDIWHVPLSPTGIGSYHGAVTATVNGQRWPENPAAIPLAEHNQIVLNVGRPVVSPPPINWSGTGL